MKERLLILAAASGALVLFVTMFLSSERGFGMTHEVPRPTSQERGGNGYGAVQQWLAAEKIATVSLQESLGKLFERDGLPPTGNVILVTLPVTTGFSTEEYRTLDRWVRAGNTLLVVAALADQPDWAHGFGERASSDLNLLTGLQFQRSARLPSSDRAFIEPQRAHLVPNRPHAYFSGVQEAVALSDFPREDWTVGIPSDAFVFSLAHDSRTGAGVLWTRSLGQGRVIVSGFGSIFTNRALGLADNARLLANILGANLAPDGSVLFDDIHQGLSATYDPAKFYRDRRLYYTLGVLIAVWLCWLLGSTRLGWANPRTVAARAMPRDAELIRATGGFFARVLRSDVAARRMFELFFQRLYTQVPRARGADGMPWSYLERHSAASADVHRLRDWYREAHASRRVPLLALHNLIVKIES